MKLIIRSIAIGMVLLFLHSCQDRKPNVTFSTPIDGKKVDFSQFVGTSFQVMRTEKKINFHVFFDPKTAYNHIIKGTKDTIFSGTITKKNNLFLLNRELKYGNFAIHAIAITKTTIKGLESEWLQGNLIRYELEHGAFQGLVENVIKKQAITLDKKEGEIIFLNIIEQLPVEELIY